MHARNQCLVTTTTTEKDVCVCMCVVVVVYKQNMHSRQACAQNQRIRPFCWLQLVMETYVRANKLSDVRMDSNSLDMSEIGVSHNRCSVVAQRTVGQITKV